MFNLITALAERVNTNPDKWSERTNRIVRHYLREINSGHMGNLTALDRAYADITRSNNGQPRDKEIML